MYFILVKKQTCKKIYSMIEVLHVDLSQGETGPQGPSGPKGPRGITVSTF